MITIGTRYILYKAKDLNSEIQAHSNELYSLEDFAEKGNRIFDTENVEWVKSPSFYTRVLSIFSKRKTTSPN